MSDKVTLTILKTLENFLDGKFGVLSDNERQNPVILHYFNEIIRYWSKINFILKKTLRSLKIELGNDKRELVSYLFLIYRIIWEGASLDDINKELSIKNPHIISRIQTFSFDKAFTGKSREERLSINEAIPSFTIERLLSVMKFDFLKENLESMNNINEQDNFTVFLDQNIEKVLNFCSIDRLQKDLNINQPLFTKDSNVNHLFQVPIQQKSEILKSELYKSYDLTILDKASAAVIDILSPQPDDFICDMCAAPGIKTDIINKQTSNQVSIIAGEFLTSRAYQMSKFLARSNQNNLNLLNIDSIIFPLRNEIKFDKILLDAPCTGSGTFLKNPEIKWRQSEKFLYQNVTLQKKLLRKAIDMLKPNGILIYSTCSLYPEEGEQQILDVLDMVEPMELPKWISPSYEIGGKIVPGTGRLFPALHQTQGFFISLDRARPNLLLPLRA